MEKNIEKIPFDTVAARPTPGGPPTLRYGCCAPYSGRTGPESKGERGLDTLRDDRHAVSSGRTGGRDERDGIPFETGALHQLFGEPVVARSVAVKPCILELLCIAGLS